MQLPPLEMATIRLDSTRSDEAMQKAAYKKEILSAKKLFEASAQVPSPSKDFAQILITEGGVVWRRWKITLRGISSGGVPSPNEEAMTHEDFGYDTTLQDQVERIFGAELLRQMKRILSGSRDELSKLPEGVMVGVATYLDLQSIARLAQVRVAHYLHTLITTLLALLGNCTLWSTPTLVGCLP